MPFKGGGEHIIATGWWSLLPKERDMMQASGHTDLIRSAARPFLVPINWQDELLPLRDGWALKVMKNWLQQRTSQNCYLIAIVGRAINWQAACCPGQMLSLKWSQWPGDICKSFREWWIYNEQAGRNSHLPFVFGPLFAMDRMPRLLCFRESLISSANLPVAVLKILLPPLPVPILHMQDYQTLKNLDLLFCLECKPRTS